MASLDIINVDQVDYIITMARDLEEGLPGEADGDEESHRGEAVDPELVKEHEYDTSYQELMGFLKTLSEDELVALVALFWIGRASYDPEDLPLALDEARAIGVARIPDYLLSSSLLAEYLEEGMTILGIITEET
ncbi:DUF3775 domain-containing protein [Govanella unica]|uniref:DUF3775 domain-containing protein n=1 Tax=Govanella unica TaxID=2975056 RepID=A0A9X3Z890_9PROT|nr:DUF3775 domain-containing protein [Govania unica]MDA5194853.1 DUF3775 domain-containing protein [Govania unica]